MKQRLGKECYFIYDCKITKGYITQVKCTLHDIKLFLNAKIKKEKAESMYDHTYESVQVSFIDTEGDIVHLQLCLPYVFYSIKDLFNFLEKEFKELS